MRGKVVISSPPPQPPPPAAAECCMCGDYGLPTELFQCKVCLSRYQHKYCSDLYLKSEVYHACNWCLRAASSSSSKNNNTSSSRPCSSDNNNNNNNINGGNSVKINRTSFSSNLHKPVKKQRLLPQLLKGRVRRYKLLEDVSS